MAAWTPTEATVSLSGRGCRVRACSSDRVLGLCSASSHSVAQLSSPSKRPVAKAAPSAAEPRASAAGIDSRGTGWAMVQVSGGRGHVCRSREDGTGISKRTGLHLVRALPTEPRPRAPSGDTWPYCKVRLRTARHPVAACRTASGRGVIPTPSVPNPPTPTPAPGLLRAWGEAIK